jgi:hypothetical protein
MMICAGIVSYRSALGAVLDRNSPYLTRRMKARAHAVGKHHGSRQFEVASTLSRRFPTLEGVKGWRDLAGQEQ